MNLLILAAIIIAVLAVLAAVKTKGTSREGGLDFDRRDPLFTPAERSFLGVLEQAVDSRFRVFGKVRLGDLVKPAKGLSKSRRTTALNKINQKHLDYVICSATDLAVVGVIELDDQSHGREDRADRDTFLDQALTSAKIPIVRFSARKAYSIPEVRAKLAETFKPEGGPITSPVAPSAIEETKSPLQPEPPVAESSDAVISAAAPSLCPKCSSSMVKRQAKNGPHAGKYFWACSAYPKCRQVVELIENT